MIQFGFTLNACSYNAESQMIRRRDNLACVGKVVATLGGSWNERMHDFQEANGKPLQVGDPRVPGG